MWAHLQRWRWALLVAAILVAGLVFALWPEATEVDTGKVGRLWVRGPSLMEGYLGLPEADVHECVVLGRHVQA